MKNRILLLLSIGCMVLSGCTNSDVTPTELVTVPETETVTETTQRPTEPWSPTEEVDDIEYSISVEESAALELAKCDAVFDKTQEVMNTEEFKNADDDRKVEMLFETLEDISENGTEEYPESLVLKDSWVYYPEYQEITFEFFNGGEGDIYLYDPFDPYDPSQTDITAPTA